MAYWMGNLVCDYVLATIPSFFFFLIVAFGGVSTFSHHIVQVIFLVLSFLFPLVTLTYCMTFLFKKSERAFRMIGTVFMLTGYLIPVLMLNVNQAVDNCTIMGTITIILSCFIPFVSFFNTMFSLVLKGLADDINTPDENIFPINKILCQTVFTSSSGSIPLLLVQGIVFLVIAVSIDIKLQDHFRKDDVKQPTDIPPLLEPDTDVIEEERRVQSLNPEDTNIRVANLFKAYSNGFAAVSGTSFGVGKREVLGLLGPNGAGKSTTFNVMTMDICRSFGEVQLLGKDLAVLDPKNTGNQLGICP